MDYAKIEKRRISDGISLLDALKRMDIGKVKMLLVFGAQGQFLSLLTIGDIQRAIIAGVSLDTPVSRILDMNKEMVREGEDLEKVKAVMTRLRAECMPVLDAEGQLKDVYFWTDFFGEDAMDNRPKMDLPVVIMAGGKGTRLRPLTNVLPKPLIPVGEHTIVEEIMSRFRAVGCQRFFISLNYKSEMVRFYMEHLDNASQISFFEEDSPMGTIGSISLLKGKIDTPFFVSNCDIIIDQDFRDVYEYHRQNNNDMTIITAVKSTRIPYGVIEAGADGLMSALREKPESTYMINTGVYILNPGLIDDVPSGAFFHVTDLMEKVRSRGGRIGCFPVSEHAWKDMGEWREYLKLIDVL